MTGKGGRFDQADGDGVTSGPVSRPGSSIRAGRGRSRLDKPSLWDINVFL